MQAVPKSIALRMDSTVLVPMAFLGGSRLIAGSWAVPEVSALRERRMPGWIVPPRKTPSLSRAVIVVAVPISMMQAGAPYSARTATAATTRSEPACAGLSIAIFKPVLSPGPTVRGRRPVSRSSASQTEVMTGGTTEEMMEPSSETGSTPNRASMDLRSAQYWSEVLI